eukprot:1206858-Alexandrium_andersonii.AAC.1
MPDATPADQGSAEPAAAGPVSADPVVAEASEVKDEPMAEAKSEESSSSPAVQTVDDAQPAATSGSAPLVQARFGPKGGPEGDADMSTVPESSAPLGATPSRNDLSDWLREGHDGRIFTSPEEIARREQRLAELRR